MNKYQITNKSSGLILGIYEGENEAAAMLAMNKDAGYESTEAAADVLGVTSEELSADLEIKLVRQAVICQGQEVDFDGAAQLMDNELREGLHNVTVYQDNQHFFDTYCAAHKARFGTEFMVN